MYMIVQGTNTYIHALKTDNSHMYVIVKGKPTYAKKDTVRERVKPRNSDARKNTGFQATCDTKTQENREKIKEKKHPIPQKGDLPSGVANSVTRKISLWLGENHNRWNDTQKSTLISNMLYK
jgi:hypothetical protein